MLWVPRYFCTACRLFWGWDTVPMGSRSCGNFSNAWCGACYENVKGRTNHKGHALYRAPRHRKAVACMPLKKPGPVGSNGSLLQHVSMQSTFLAPFSAILEFLSSLSWGDGSKREAGTLSMTVTAGRWSCRVKDPNGRRYAYLTAVTIDELLMALEAGLASDEMDWREDKPFGKR
jgi:hypothetical protein